MKPLFTLLFLLVCTLASKFSDAYACGNKLRLPTYHQVDIEKKQPDIVFSNVLCIINTTTYAEHENDLLCIEEDEQEETGRSSSATRYFIAFYYTFVLSNRNFISFNAPFSYRPSFYSGSCKYITQRVLRI